MKVDYQKTIIYKLCCRDVNIKEIYIGHTTNFKLRNKQHKTDCNNPNYKQYNSYKYKFIRDNGGYSNWNMIIIKDYPCNNKREAEAEENRIMIELGASLNSQKSYTTEEQKKEDRKNYNKQNKDIINEKQKNYYQQNKDNILEKQKEKVICDKCDTAITKRYLKQHQKSDKCKKLSVCMILDDD